MGTTTGSTKYVTKEVSKTSWLAIPNGNQTNPESLSRYPDKTVQIFGTFGVGGSVNIEGSNDGGTTWAILHDSRGAANPLTITAAGIFAIAENPELIRANVTAGDGTTAINVIIVSRGSE